MHFTSVTGHLTELDFPSQYKSWESSTHPPASPFDAPTVRFVKPDNQPIASTLEAEARASDWLVLWLDCDREGENIAFEVMHVCSRIKPSLRVYRARFSALIPADIHRALQSLSGPSKPLSDAVDARQEIDLKLGAIFTRWQTMTLRRHSPLVDGVVSYGPCQFPTLGFVVERYRKRAAFTSDRYWQISAECSGSGGETVKFSWERERCYDRLTAVVVYERMVESDEVRVVKADSKKRTRRRPLPLTTVTMQMKLASHARLSAHQAMEVAEKLYQEGIISYPRTETDSYKQGTDLQALIATLSTLPSDLGQYATKLLNQPGAFVYPGDGGHDDHAHPPIHPTRAEAGLQGDRRVVYEFVVRHFLACCSGDAQGEETVVTAECAPSMERLTASGLMITARNYLDVYKYDRWYAHLIPVFSVGQALQSLHWQLTEGQTLPPPLLSESELIALMDREGIGTDATIAQHIEHIQKRGYVVLRQRVFVPTKLGLGLVTAYEAMGLSLSSPNLRAHMERLITDVGEGRRTKAEVVSSVLADMRVLFDSCTGQRDVLCREVEEQLCSDTTPEERVVRQGFPLAAQDDERPARGAGGRPGGAGDSTDGDGFPVDGALDGRSIHSAALCCRWSFNVPRHNHSPGLVAGCSVTAFRQATTRWAGPMAAHRAERVAGAEAQSAEAAAVQPLLVLLRRQRSPHTMAEAAVVQARASATDATNRATTPINARTEAGSSVWSMRSGSSLCFVLHRVLCTASCLLGLC